MFKFKKTEKQIDRTLRNFQTMVDVFFEKFGDNLQKNVNFNKKRFIILYIVCVFYCFEKTVKSLFFDFELSCNTFSEFKIKFVPRTMELLPKSVEKGCLLTGQLSAQLFDLWCVSSQNSLWTDIVDVNVDVNDENVGHLGNFTILENENLLLTSRIHEQINKVKILNIQLTPVEYVYVSKEEFDLILNKYSEKLTILAELLFFRKELIHLLFNINEFKFSKFNLLHLLLLVDGEIALFLYALADLHDTLVEIKNCKKQEGF